MAVLVKQSDTKEYYINSFGVREFEFYVYEYIQVTFIISKIYLLYSTFYGQALDLQKL